MPARTTAIAALVALGCVATASGVLYGRETVSPLPESTTRLMYLTSGRTADRLFLTFDALAADVYWIRTIQHYGRDRRSARTSGRFEFLQPLLDLTTTLDPQFNIAYRFGAIFLSMDPPHGPGRPEQAIALLQKGLAANPRRWQYAHDIGFVHYWHTRDFEAAARWFRRAADMPGAPEWIEPLAALTLAQGGDRDGARRIFTELLQSDEPYIRNAADRALAQLDALETIEHLQADVNRFHERAARYPEGWAELVQAGLLPGIPLDPTGTPYILDPTTHAVGLAPASPLAPLPQAFDR